MANGHPARHGNHRERLGVHRHGVQPMSALDGRMAVRNGRSCSTRIGPKAGFTLLEVAIAGAILMGGLGILAQLVRTTLSSTTPGFTEGAQVGPVVEQQIRLLAAYSKAYYESRPTPSNRQAFGAVKIYTESSTRSFIHEPMLGYAGQTYAVTEQEITCKLTNTSSIATSSSDPTVGFTRFWKLEVYHPTSHIRTGL